MLYSPSACTHPASADLLLHVKQTGCTVALLLHSRHLASMSHHSQNLLKHAPLMYCTTHLLQSIMHRARHALLQAMSLCHGLSSGRWGLHWMKHRDSHCVTGLKPSHLVS